MVLFLSGLVLTPLNKTIVQNENIITFLMLSAPFSFLPLFLSAFGVRLHSLLCTPLIVFLHQLHITNHHLSFSMDELLTTPLIGFLVVFALSLFLLLNEQNSSLVLVSVVSLVMVCLKRGFAAMIPFLITFVSLVMLSFGNIVLSRVFSSFLCLLPQSLPFLLIFSSISILNLWRILQHWLPLQTTYLQFCPRHMIPHVLDLVAPPSPESLIGLELRHSTWVSIPPPYLIDYHCSFCFCHPL